jgi:hypothetical protein
MFADSRVIRHGPVGQMAIELWQFFRATPLVAPLLWGSENTKSACTIKEYYSRLGEAEMASHWKPSRAWSEAGSEYSRASLMPRTSSVLYRRVGCRAEEFCFVLFNFEPSSSVQVPKSFHKKHHHRSHAVVMEPRSLFRVRHRKGTTTTHRDHHGDNNAGDAQREETGKKCEVDDLDDTTDKESFKSSSSLWPGNNENSRKRKASFISRDRKKQYFSVVVFWVCFWSVVFGYGCYFFFQAVTSKGRLDDGPLDESKSQQGLLRQKHRLLPPEDSFGSQEQQQHLQNDHHHHQKKKKLTVYAQNPKNNGEHQQQLEKHVYADLDLDCAKPYLHFPIDTDTDPYLPWIHDYFVAPASATATRRQASTSGRTSSTTTINPSSKSMSNDDEPYTYEVRFIAQNKRRCDTGHGKENVMEYWEPQMALFQPITIMAVVVEKNTTSHTRYQYRLVDPNEETANDDDDKDRGNRDHHGDTLTLIPETRFACRFHFDTSSNSTGRERDEDDDDDSSSSATMMTFSKYPFNYEYLNWRKRGNGKPMFEKHGPDVKIFDHATLLFSCPIPPAAAASLQSSNSLWLDIIPIRTLRARHDDGYLLTPHHVGPDEFQNLHRFNMTRHYGPRDSAQRIIPPFHQLGRIENLPICLPPPPPPVSASASVSASPPRDDETNKTKKKRHKLVACTWAAASYNRRGGKHVVSDTAARFKEWVVYHRLVGYDQIYVYDNTQLVSSADETTTAASSSSMNHHQEQQELLPLKQVAQLFPGFVTYIPWPGA